MASAKTLHVSPAFQGIYLARDDLIQRGCDGIFTVNDTGNPCMCGDSSLATMHLLLYDNA